MFDSFGLMIVFVTFFGFSIGYDYQTISNASCKTIAFVGRIFLIAPSWIKCLVTLDRLIYVLQVRALKFMQKRRFISLLVVAIISVIALSSLANIQFSLTTATNVTFTVNNESHRTITYSCTSLKDIVLVRDTIAISLRTIIPFMLIVCSNVKIINTFYRSKQSYLPRRSIKTSNHSYSRARKEYFFLISVIALDILFVFVLAPISVTLILLDVYAFVPSLTTPTRLAAARVAYFITFYMSTVPYASGFVVSMIFNRIFRHEFFRIVRRFKNMKRSIR